VAGAILRDLTAVGARSGTRTKFEQNGMTFFGGIIFGVTANMAEIEDNDHVGRSFHPTRKSVADQASCRSSRRGYQDKFYRH